MTLVVLIFAEVTPKPLPLYPERVAFPSSLILRPLLTLLYPVVTSVNFITNSFMRLLGIDPKRAHVGDALSSDELRTVVNEASNLIPTRTEMLTSILDLEKVTVEDVMIPRNEIVGIDINDVSQKSPSKLNTHNTPGCCSIATISMMQLAFARARHHAFDE